MAQMEADTILMKNWTLICGKEYLCRKVLKKWMWMVHNESPTFQLKGTSIVCGEH